MVDFTKPVLCDGEPCVVLHHAGRFAWIRHPATDTPFTVLISRLANAPEKLEVWLRVYDEGETVQALKEPPRSGEGDDVVYYRITIEGDRLTGEKVK